MQHSSISADSAEFLAGRDSMAVTDGKTCDDTGAGWRYRRKTSARSSCAGYQASDGRINRQSPYHLADRTRPIAINKAESPIVFKMQS